MAAVAYQRWEPVAVPRFERVPVGPCRRRPSAAVYRRRRLLAVVAVVLAMVIAVVFLKGALGWLGGGPLTASEPPAPDGRAAPAVHVVQPGDSLWSIARSLQPRGDVRGLVGRLADARGGVPIQAGERIALP